jgi:hypothetical protein
MTDIDTEINTETVTLETLAARLDSLGKQMDWVCENLAALFQFVNQIGSNGGGIRGMMALLKQGPPPIPAQSEIKNA